MKRVFTIRSIHQPVNAIKMEQGYNAFLQVKRYKYAYVQNHFFIIIAFTMRVSHSKVVVVEIVMP